MKDPAFLFYPGDYLRDTQCLSEKVQVAYDRIMCEHMRNICISQQQLKFFTKKLSQEEIEELLMVLSKNENGYQITWVAESIEKRRVYSESRRKNRTTSKKDMNNICSSHDKHMENEIEIENKDEVVTEKEKKERPKKCLFKNSEFADFDKFQSAFPWQEFFPGADIRHYFDSFMDWSANGNLKTDWIATVRNGIRRDMATGKMVMAKAQQQTYTGKSAFQEMEENTKRILEDVRKQKEAAGNNG